MEDIATRIQIEDIVERFYIKLMDDDIVGHFFNDVIELDLREHLPTIVDFWEGILLDNPIYQGNPMIKHIELDQKSKIAPIHFKRWLELWEETINESYIGPISSKAIDRAKSIGSLMQFKVEQARGLFN